MLPLVFPTLDVPPVTDLVGAPPQARIYRHGDAPQGVSKPYITWFVVSGQPYDQISGAPCSDFDQVQIDCWHTDDTGIERLTLAVRNALDAAGISNRLVIDQRNAETKLYRIAIEADFISNR